MNAPTRPLPPPPTPTPQQQPRTQPPTPQPPTPRKRYDGPLTIIGIDLNDPTEYHRQEAFVHGPFEEPISVSIARLVDALRNDGETEFRPTTIWRTYRRHPELSRPLTETENMKKQGMSEKWT